MRGLTQLGGAQPQQVAGMQVPQQVAGMQVPTLPTTVAPAQAGLDIASILNMMIMMMIVVMMMKMMTGAMATIT